MGKHSARTEGLLTWVRGNRLKTLALAVATLSLVSRYAPGFPSDSVLEILRILLGA